MMDARDKRDERSRAFEETMLYLLRAEALAMSLDGPLDKYEAGLDSLVFLTKADRAPFCESIIEKCGMSSAVMLTMAMIEHMLDSDKIAFCHDDRSIWAVGGDWEIKLPEDRDNCG